MKTTKLTMTRIASTMLAIFMAGTGAVGIVSATAPDASAALATASAPAKSARYYKQMEKLRYMQESSIGVIMRNDGAYVQKTAKLYGRKVIGVDDNGDFILGKWQLLKSLENVPSWETNGFKINGAYVAFAYSFDIVWGTDFPYSGVFWNYPDYEVAQMEIITSGTCRSADVKMHMEYYDKTKGKTDYRIWTIGETDCNSHKEWKP